MLFFAPAMPRWIAFFVTSAVLHGARAASIDATYAISVADAEPLQTLDDLYIGFNIDSGALFFRLSFSS